jgi:predicted transcriptional regulator of viral defense system
MARRTTLRQAVNRLADAGQEFFTVGDLRAVLGLTPPQARHLAFRLAKANLARRIKRGTYALLPPADWDDTEALGINWYLAAAAAAEPAPYFLAYYTAMEINQMIQHPLRTVFIAVLKQRPEKELGAVRFRFVTLEQRRFFGFEERQVERGKAVKVADLERAFLDCVDRPELCGGLHEVFRGFARRHDELNRDRLLRYLIQLNRPALAKRVGFLLEAVGHPDPILLWELERIAGRIRHYLPLDPMMNTERAERNRRWELLINTDLDQMMRTTLT